MPDQREHHDRHRMPSRLPCPTPQIRRARAQLHDIELEQRRTVRGRREQCRKNDGNFGVAISHPLARPTPLRVKAG